MRVQSVRARLLVTVCECHDGLLGSTHSMVPLRRSSSATHRSIQVRQVAFDMSLCELQNVLLTHVAVPRAASSPIRHDMDNNFMIPHLLLQEKVLFMCRQRCSIAPLTLVTVERVLRCTCNQVRSTSDCNSYRMIRMSLACVSIESFDRFAHPMAPKSNFRQPTTRQPQ